MRLLLDTHVVLGQLSGERPLSSAAIEAVGAADDLLISVVSFAEMGIKAAVGKLDIPGDIAARIADAGVRSLALSPEHALAVASLPVHHRDPFDRMIIAQAMAEGLTVVSADARFQDYGIDVIEA
ncbi:MAG: type II toxin-antitoxin system VapC family toxin [Actinomycetia bacterium]|nr:type II toxin-antitoxin system VapC family toxin [Actinomycetes bacterium]